MSTLLIVPGLQNSGPLHWQSWFEQQLPGTRRVEQSDWDTPDLSRWTETVSRAIAETRGEIWIVAHSFGCLASVCAASLHPDRVAGAMLVAPADPDRFGLGAEVPRAAPGFPCVVVGSLDDPWMSFAKAAYWAECWGARFISLGRAGHINADAGFGPWPAGLDIFRRLRESRTGDPQGSLRV